MPRFIAVDSLEDPRLAPYRNLRERTLRGESIFIAEGRLVTERLLASSFPVESILITRESLETLTSDFFDKAKGIPIFEARERSFVSQIAGFPFHQGMMAVGRRRPLPNFVEAYHSHDAKSGIWIVLPDATKPENLGLVFRSAAALQAAGVVLGERCCDPFSRRALRVSMGGVLQVPVICARDLRSEIETLRNVSPPIRFYATLLASDALKLSDIREIPSRAALLFGNEYDGLDDASVSLCHEKITIPMAQNVDSLNLGVSVGIFLYEFLQKQNRGLEIPNRIGENH